MYTPGTGAESWLSNGDGAFTKFPFNIGTAHRTFIGDFNGDGVSDIFWYRSGNIDDFAWISKGDGSFAKTRLHENGSHRDVFLDDLNGDGWDDILWTPDDHWLSNGNGTFERIDNR